jgi:hypothetical protein
MRTAVRGEATVETHKPADSPQRDLVKTIRIVGLTIVVVIVLGMIAPILWLTGLGSYLAQRGEYAGRTPTFSGRSDQLKQTIIVPTLDTPSPPGKNVIWCSSFQLAWIELRDNVIRYK